MSSDLSANIRRGELERKSDEARFANKVLRDDIVKLHQDAYKAMLERLDSHAKTHGYLKSDMLNLVYNLGLNEFSVYYNQYSNAYDGEKH